MHRKAPRLQLLLVPVALLLAGCAGDDQTADDPTADADGASGTGEHAGHGAGASQAEPRPDAPTVLHLTGARQLTEEPAGAGKVTMNFAPSAIVQGGQPTIVAGPQWAHDLLVRSVRIDGHVGTDVPVVGTQLEGEIIVWIGVDGRLAQSVFIDAPDVLLPGDAAPFSADIALDKGVVVPAGSQLTLALGTLYSDDDSLRHTHLLTGPETGTTLTLQAEWADLPALGVAQEILAGGAEVAGSACAGTATGMESTELPFDVPAGTAYIEAHMAIAASTNSGNDDMDLWLVDAAGEVVGRTTGPVGTESLLLWAPQIEVAAPGTWTAIITTCAAQQASFTLQVLAASAEAVAATAVEAAPS